MEATTAQPDAGREKRKAKKARQRAKKKAKKQAAKEERLKATLAHLPQPTQHALDRWEQRFRPDELFFAAYARSESIEWETLKREASEASLLLRLTPQSEFRRDRVTGAVFVIMPKHGGGKEVRTVVRLRLYAVSKGA